MCPQETVLRAFLFLNMVKKTTRYQCDYCNEDFGSEAMCDEHEHIVHLNAKPARLVELSYMPGNDAWGKSNEKAWVDAERDLSHPETNVTFAPFDGLSWRTFCEPGKAHVKAAYEALRLSARDWLDAVKRQLEDVE